MKGNSQVFLAIDDKLENLISIKALIKESFPESVILTTQSGKEGLKLAQEQEPDIILLDIMMPDMNGYDVCRVLKADPVLQDIPVIFVTALNSDRETRLKAVENGAEAFIHKPIDELELLIQLRTLLRLREFNVKKKERIINLEEGLLGKSKELEASDERFRLMIESISDTIGITDVNGNVKFRTPNNEKLFGIKPEDAVGQNSFDFVHLDDRDRLQSEFLSLIEDGSGAKRTGEFKYLRKDGSVVNVELEGRNMLDNKHIDGLLLTFRDITEKKAASRKTEEASEKLRALVESTEDMVWLVDPDNFGLITFNTALYHYFETGRGIKIKIGMRPEEMLPDDYASEWHAMYNKVLEQGAYKVEYETSAKNRILELSFYPVKIGNETIGISVMGQDITERKQAERKIMAANKNFNAIISNSMFGAVTVGKDKKIRWANPAAITMMGLDCLEEVLGKKCTEYFCPAQKDFCPIMDLGQTVDNSEKKMKTHDGKEIPIIKSVSEIEIDGESLLLETFIDITERKTMELALRENEERFRGIISSMDDVVYTLDAEQRHTGVFGSWVRKNNLTENFFLGKTASDIYGPELGKIHEAPSNKALAGENVVYEWDLINGNERNYFQTSLSPMYDIEGKVIGVVGIGRDITSIKKTEIELVNSKDRFIKAQEMGRFGHWSYNIDTQKFIGSKVTFDIYGFDELDTVSFDDVVSCISKADVERITEKFNKLILDGAHFDEQFEINPRGSEHPISIRDIAGISTDENGVKIIEGVVQDISELRELEYRIIDKSKQNQRILDNLQDAYFQTDLKSMFTIVNPKAVTMYGYQSIEEMIGLRVGNLYENAEDVDYLIKELKKNGFLTDYVCKGRKKDNTTFWISVNIQFVKDDFGKIVGTEGIVRDISERIKLEEAIKIQRDNLIESNEKLSKSEAKFKIMLETIPAALFLSVDNHTKVGYLSSYFTEMLGYSYDDLPTLEKWFEKAYPDETYRKKVMEETTDSFVKSLSDPTFKTELNSDVTCKDGSVKHLQWRGLMLDNQWLGCGFDLTRIHEANIKLSQRLHQSVLAISKIGEMRDVYTAGHQKRVQELAVEIAHHMGLSDEAIMNISYGALIHDIGKIYIASDILNKPGKITNLEFQILQTHAEHGFEIVKEIDFPEEIPAMIYQHHERLDGTGYPQGLSGGAILLESRILAVADVVEAMTSHRPYRPALGIEAALEEIELHKGTRYDANIVDICTGLFKEKNFSFSD